MILLQLRHLIDGKDFCIRQRFFCPDFGTWIKITVAQVWYPIIFLVMILKTYQRGEKEWSEFFCFSDYLAP